MIGSTVSRYRITEKLGAGCCTRRPAAFGPISNG